jgi:hypothetical protein
VEIAQVIPAESGWKAVFQEPEGGESTSRILGWAVVAGVADDDQELVGLIIDPAEPSQIVAATEAASPEGGSFLRYRFVPPEPIKIAAPPTQSVEEAAGQAAKSLLKRGRK